MAARIIFLPNIKDQVSAVGLGVWDDGVHFDSLGLRGEELGRKAIADLGGGVVRLYARTLEGNWVVLHSLTGESKGDQGLWATWWCQGEV